MKITLQDLRTVGDRETASQVLAEGTWNLKFQLKAGDLSVQLPVGQTLEWNGMTATIDALVVSPIGYYLRYTVDQQAEPVASGTGQMTQAQEEQWARFDLPHGLKRTDGTVLSLSDGTGSTGQGPPARAGAIETTAKTAGRTYPLPAVFVIPLEDVWILPGEGAVFLEKSVELCYTTHCIFISKYPLSPNPTTRRNPS